MRLELAGAAWAELRDADQIPRKPARAFRKVLYKVAAPTMDSADPTLDAVAQAAAVGKALLASGDGLDSMEDLAESLVLAVVSEWSFGAVTSEVLDTVPDAAVDAIYEECTKGGYIEKLMPDFGPSPDESSPTTPS